MKTRIFLLGGILAISHLTNLANGDCASSVSETCGVSHTGDVFIPPNSTFVKKMCNDSREAIMARIFECVKTALDANICKDDKVERGWLPFFESMTSVNEGLDYVCAHEEAITTYGTCMSLIMMMDCITEKRSQWSQDRRAKMLDGTMDYTKDKCLKIRGNMECLTNLTRCDDKHRITYEKAVKLLHGQLCYDILPGSVSGAGQRRSLQIILMVVVTIWIVVTMT